MATINLDRDKYLGTCFNPISNRDYPKHHIDPLMVHSKDSDKVRIRVNYYSSSAEYDESRNVKVDGGISTPFDIVGLNTKDEKKTHESGRQKHIVLCVHL